MKAVEKLQRVALSTISFLKKIKKDAVAIANAEQAKGFITATSI